VKKCEELFGKLEEASPVAYCRYVKLGKKPEGV